MLIASSFYISILKLFSAWIGPLKTMRLQTSYKAAIQSRIIALHRQNIIIK